jgi:hypothetical protein
MASVQAMGMLVVAVAAFLLIATVIMGVRER